MKAVILTGQYATEQEVFYPMYRLDEEGIEWHLATPDGKQTVGASGLKIVPTHMFTNIDIGHYDLCIIPGGAKAMEYLRQNLYLLTLLMHAHALGQVIASICHGAQLLISAGLVKDRDISGYYSIKDDILNAGGRFSPAAVVRDGRIITSPHYKYCGFWMAEALRVLKLPRGVGEGDVGVE